MKSSPSSHLITRLRGPLKSLCGLLALLLIFNSAPAYAQCASPVGVAGQVIHGDDDNVPAYCDGTDWIAMIGGNPKTSSTNYSPNAVDFDGTNDYLETTGYADAAPLTTVSGSFWVFRSSTGLGTNQPVIVSQNLAQDGYFRIRFNNANEVTIDGRDTATTSFDTFMNSSNTITDDGWHHVLFSIDVTNNTLQNLYVDDVDVLNSTGNTDTEFGDNIDRINIGSEFQTGNNPFHGQLSEVWVEFGTYIDFSLEANRRKFIDPSGNPVYLGANGSAPTGSAADIFLSGNTANWHTNKGAGGGFTEIGELTDSATLPFTPSTQISPSGLVAYYRMDETSGTAVEDFTVNGYDASANGAISAQTGAINTAIDADEITLDTDDVFDSLTEGTISAWIKWNGSVTSETSVFTLYNTGADSYFQPLQVQNGEMKLYGCSTNFTSNTQPIKPGKWHHILYHSDSSNGHKVYVDGIEVRSSAVHAFFNNCDSVGNPSNYRIGHAGGFEQFDGPIDDLRIYNRVLTNDEIQQLARARDGISYNKNHHTMEYFDGHQFISMTPEWLEPPLNKSVFTDGSDASCGAIGNICSNGSVYAGISPDGNAHIFTTPSDAPGSFTWNNGTATFTNTALVDCTDGPPGSETTCQHGQTNSAFLASLSDAASPHAAATYCENLSVHGENDWYLPSQDELAVLYTNRNDIGNFLNGASDFYWSSSEHDDNDARNMRASDGAFGTNNRKDDPLNIRCIRKGNLQNISSGNLIGHWRLDETTGTVAYDSSGNGNNGSLNNMDASENSTTGPSHTSLDFNSINEYITVPDDPVFDTITNQVTAAAWVYKNSVQGSSGSDGGYNAIFTRERGTATEDVFWIGYGNQSTDNYTGIVHTSSGRIILNTGVSSATDLNQWVHMAMTYDGTNIRFYRNGTQIGIAAHTGTFQAEDNVLVIGAGSNDDGVTFDGHSHAAVADVRLYNRALETTEIQQLFNAGTAVGSSTALPQGCPNIGDVCDDGTYYVGLSPDGNVEMYAAPEDAPSDFAWNNDQANGTVTSASDTNAGAANTDEIIKIDADGNIAGFQQHESPQYCHDLSVAGANDWYLPADNELLNLYNGGNQIANVNTGWQYWTSREISDSTARSINMGAGNGVNRNKSVNLKTRCVRKGPAPRCANPYGLEGQLVYNACYRVVQYCDGARWIMIGKSEAVNECS